MHPGVVVLIKRVLLTVVITLVLAALVALVVAAVSDNTSPGTWLTVCTIAFALTGLPSALRQWLLWRQSLFRITTERIIMQYPVGLFSEFQKTIKWPQYQESYVGRGGFFSLLFGTRMLCIRYGGADGELTMCFPALRHAQDIKHFLDKVDSAVRHKDEQSLRPFVAKPRGKRY